MFAHPVYLHGIRVKFVYEGHRVKVTGAKKVANAWSDLRLEGMLVVILSYTERAE